MTELLEHDPLRTPLRSWLVVGGLVVVALALGVEDRRAHAAEAVRVQECASAVGQARALADRRVGSMAGYVRPAFNGSYTTETRDGLAGLVGSAARRSRPPLAGARESCARIDVRLWHGTLRGRVDACLSTADVRLRWLDDVSRDGGLAYRSSPVPTPGCSA